MSLQGTVRSIDAYEESISKVRNMKIDKAMQEAQDIVEVAFTTATRLTGSYVTDTLIAHVFDAILATRLALLRHEEYPMSYESNPEEETY